MLTGIGEAVAASDVPDVTGHQVDQALKELSDYKVVQEPDDISGTVDRGLVIVIEENVAADPDGYAFEVVLTLGSVVPDLVGRPSLEAQKDLKSHGLNYDAGRELNDDWLVRRQKPAPGTWAKIGETVTVELTPPVLVPAVVGLDETAAGNTVSNAGLALVVKLLSEGAVPGTVARQEPSPGTPVLPGTTVSAWVRRVAAPVLVVVPRLIGMEVEEARRAAAAAGLGLSVAGPDGSAGSRVASQQPAGGARVPRGTKVTVVLVTSTTTSPPPSSASSGTSSTSSPGRTNEHSPTTDSHTPVPSTTVTTGPRTGTVDRTTGWMIPAIAAGALLLAIASSAPIARALRRRTPQVTPTGRVRAVAHADPTPQLQVSQDVRRDIRVNLEPHPAETTQTMMEVHS
jgi:beta-lactam-binding protein with PASTA domain